MYHKAVHEIFGFTKQRTQTVIYKMRKVEIIIL
jgi:hypothetical protein